MTVLGGVLVAGLVPSAVATAAAAESVTAAASRTVTITHVTDGDTVDTSGGETVRVLGIDACETDTAGGQAATAEARRLLAGKTVTLVQEPGVGTDPYGRQLRYITLPSGADYGLRVVGADHTGVYQGENDAAPAYLDQLRARDNGRHC